MYDEIYMSMEEEETTLQKKHRNIETGSLAEAAPYLYGKKSAGCRVAAAGRANELPMGYKGASPR